MASGAIRRTPAMRDYQPINPEALAVRRFFADGWQDAGCVRAGDEYLGLAVRCYAAASLADRQIVGRIVDLVGIEFVVDTEPDTAAVELAHHCATMAVPIALAIAVQAYLAAADIGWPDADAIASIVQDAYRAGGR
jgi:hypothetical protein